MRISVVIPTIQGREELLLSCVEDYEELTPDPEIIVVRDMPSCGAAWQAGAEQATGEYLHLTADDLEPLPGWWEPAIYAVEERCIVPAARVWRPGGGIESGVAWDRDGRDGDPAALAQIPFCSMEQWRYIGPMVPIQYYSDNWFQWRAETRCQLECRLVDGYEFVHHRPQGPRPGEFEQQARDRIAYERYKREGVR